MDKLNNHDCINEQINPSVEKEIIKGVEKLQLWVDQSTCNFHSLNHLLMFYLSNFNKFNKEKFAKSLRAGMKITVQDMDPVIIQYACEYPARTRSVIQTIKDAPPIRDYLLTVFHLFHTSTLIDRKSSI